MTKLGDLNVGQVSNDVKNWATEQGSGPNLGHLLSQIRPSHGMLRFAQAAQIAQPQAQDCSVIASF
jgi:hypothetical protein